ncbi:MAG TPA: sulfite exporter TauE/SafE family protein [Candidatus Limnocylindria bacterium]|nr:sulfite exporter TauE/SafE family protein [Candidatus Limnocylindria bacterium]
MYDVALAAAGFVALGIGVGTLGTLIGAGGGFILLPVLAILFPLEPTGSLTATSLAVVAANASSGAFAYSRQRRIDFRSGLAFAVATLPGSVAGALLARSIPRGPFDVSFALVLLALALVLMRTRAEQGPAAPEGRAWGRVPRELVDAEGAIHRYHVELPLGIAISFVVGFASSLLGIGGGFIHVPALIAVLGFPVHIATATSHFVLAIMATVGTLTHIAAGDLADVWPRTVYLAIGAVAGAQVGARISTRVKGTVIVRLLAGALVVVALRLAAQGVLGY